MLNGAFGCGAGRKIRRIRHSTQLKASNLVFRVVAVGFVPFGKPRDGDPVDVGIKLFGVRHKNRGERGAAVSADVKPARIVFIVVHIGEIRHGFIAARGTANAFKGLVGAARRAVKRFDVPVVCGTGDRCDGGRTAADRAMRRPLEMHGVFLRLRKQV